MNGQTARNETYDIWVLDRGILQTAEMNLHRDEATKYGDPSEADEIGLTWADYEDAYEEDLCVLMPSSATDRLDREEIVSMICDLVETHFR